MARRNTIAVIGANYGDEGKGKIVDALVRRYGPDETVVVRHNSGSQAAHTVEWFRNVGHEFGHVRHAFGHFGSGSPAGAPTLLGHKFVVNPLTFRKEREELVSKGVEPVVNVSPNAPVTTPYEMLLNQFLERKRGGVRHGSCGLGFGLTVEREKAGLAVDVLTCSQNPGVALDSARSWVALRAHAAGYTMNELLEGLDEAMMREDFCSAFRNFEGHVSMENPVTYTLGKHVVFEGAQGLKLDATNGDFPHVTRCRTGIHDAGIYAAQIGRVIDDAVYVTRSFLTRHGAGPLPGEEELKGTFDETNKENEFQGRLRTGLLNLRTLWSRIAIDSMVGPAFGKASIALTWLDWNERDDGMIRFRTVDNEVASVPRGDFVGRVEYAAGHSVSIVGLGPRTGDVEFTKAFKSH